jgi:hypothetical protein
MLRTFQLCVRPPHPWPPSRAGERGTESCCLFNGSRISSPYFVVFNRHLAQPNPQLKAVSIWHVGC